MVIGLDFRLIYVENCDIFQYIFYRLKNAIVLAIFNFKN